MQTTFFSQNYVMADDGAFIDRAAYTNPNSLYWLQRAQAAGAVLERRMGVDAYAEWEPAAIPEDASYKQATEILDAKLGELARQAAQQ